MRCVGSVGFGFELCWQSGGQFWISSVRTQGNLSLVDKVIWRTNIYSSNRTRSPRLIVPPRSTEA